MDADEIKKLSAKVDDHSQRLARVEARQATTDAVRAERDKHMDQRFDRLEVGLNEVKGYLLRIVWVIVVGILGALVTFMISGGLNAIPTP